MTAMTELVDRYGIEGRVVTGPDTARDDDGWDHYAMTVRLAYTHNGTVHELVVPWMMGLGLDVGSFTGTGGVPVAAESVAEVLEHLVFESSHKDDTFEDFAADFGYDTDSRRAYAQWELVRDQGRRFYDWCYSEAMFEELTDTAAGI